MQLKYFVVCVFYLLICWVGVIELWFFGWLGHIDCGRGVVFEVREIFGIEMGPIAPNRVI